MPDIRIRRKPATAFAQPGVRRIDVMLSVNAVGWLRGGQKQRGRPWG
ncbi:hypothetical protein M1S11_004856 [Salmonella enterica]|nr:hypothetical protein [Salmonella enterica]EGJ3923981.1 hypothetical protein [Salmonella enterica]EHJ4405385.1 hypothetical protein [Salmonella enterica]EIP1329502.1 hypothetical protein [Salmonella enterica]EJA9767509.1 hypothetical protein [Salmonella enterica]